MQRCPFLVRRRKEGLENSFEFLVLSVELEDVAAPSDLLRRSGD
jgi:hypothetical protein